MKKQYSGLVPHKAPDTPEGEVVFTCGVSLYRPQVEDLAMLRELTGIDSRSQLIRAVIRFAVQNKAEFKAAAAA